MTTYKFKDKGVQQIETESVIPPVTGNLDWQDYLKWKDAGGITLPEFTDIELAAQKAIKDKLDKAYTDLRALIAAMDPDPTKVKLEEVMAHLVQMQIIMGLR